MRQRSQQQQHLAHRQTEKCKLRRLSYGIFGGVGGCHCWPLARGQQISRLCLVRGLLCADPECRLPVTTSLLVRSSLCSHCWRTPNSITSAILRRMLWSCLMATISLWVSSSLCRHNHYIDMMMPAVMVVVPNCLLMRVSGSAPSLLPWRAGNRVAPVLPLALVPGYGTGNLNKFTVWFCEREFEEM